MESWGTRERELRYRIMGYGIKVCNHGERGIMGMKHGGMESWGIREWEWRHGIVGYGRDRMGMQTYVCRIMGYVKWPIYKVEWE